MNDQEQIERVQTALKDGKNVYLVYAGEIRHLNRPVRKVRIFKGKPRASIAALGGKHTWVVVKEGDKFVL